MHTEALGAEAKYGLEALEKLKLFQTTLKSFYLGGGTGLALHFGHRISVDLDFFSKKSWNQNELIRHLSKKGDFAVENEEKGTLHGVFEGAKISFLHYPYELLENPLEENGIKIASVRDIGCMKIDAMCSRGKKKDFIDLYFLLKKFPMSELIEMYAKKYNLTKVNPMHILKSMTYFDDADGDPDIVFIGKRISWATIKHQIIMEAQRAKNIILNSW
jgi:hypothetical protein